MGRHLERRGVLVRDTESSFLALGPQKGRKALTLRSVSVY